MYCNCNMYKESSRHPSMDGVGCGNWKSINLIKVRHYDNLLFYILLIYDMIYMTNGTESR